MLLRIIIPVRKSLFARYPSSLINRALVVPKSLHTRRIARVEELCVTVLFSPCLALSKKSRLELFILLAQLRMFLALSRNGLAMSLLQCSEAVLQRTDRPRVLLDHLDKQVRWRVRS